MKKTLNFALLILLVVGLSNCAPSDAVVQTAIAKTSEANPTSTDQPTNTPEPTVTIPPTSTSIPSAAPATTPTLGIGSTTVSEKDGMVMVYVPAGEFVMGSSDNDLNNVLAECQKINIDCQLDWFLDEQPQHTVHLDAFWIDQTEVTNAMYEKCVQAGSCNQPTKTLYFSDPNYANHPVAWVTWIYADAYCAWADRRLPSEAEWEKAAGWDEKNQKKNVYPWGNESDCQFANIGACVSGFTAVGSYENGQSPYGAYDMAGNVVEWVADWYDSGYYAISPYSNPLGPSSGSARVARGSRRDANPYDARISKRSHPIDPNGSTDSSVVSYVSLGFRCAQDAEP